MVLLEYINTEVLEDNRNRYGTAWENGKKPKGKFNLKESVIVIVITSEIAKGNLIYGRGICKTPERCTWNKTY